MHKQGLQVNTHTLRKEASQLSSDFKNKNYTGTIRSVQRFIKSIGMSHKVSTHFKQKDHKETEEESRHLILMLRNNVAGMDPDYVINMDQTPIPDSYHTLRTLEKKRVNTVHVRSSTADTKCASLVATVSANGKLLHPVLIFKGKAGR